MRGKVARLEPRNESQARRRAKAEKRTRKRTRKRDTHTADEQRAESRQRLGWQWIALVYAARRVEVGTVPVPRSTETNAKVSRRPTMTRARLNDDHGEWTTYDALLPHKTVAEVLFSILPPA